MRIGIVTFHYPCNYGAVLQCLALYRTLRAWGHEVDVIRYVPEDYRTYPPLWKGWGFRQGRMLQNLPKKLIAARHGPAMQAAFEKFRAQHLTFSRLCRLPSEIAEVVSDYDVVIAGSDQIWHFAHPAPFFLEWGAPYHGKRISYAACCGHTRQPHDRIEDIRRWLARFSHISVRNAFSQEIISQIVGRKVPVVADPTLLADLSDLQAPVAVPWSEYVLIYSLGGEIQGGTAAALKAIRERVGNLPIVAVIASAHEPQRAPWADLRIWEAGPAEWLCLLAHASFVFTDSFHAVLFSLLTKRDFLGYWAEDHRAPRLLDLGQRYYAQERVAGSAAEAHEKLRKPFDTARSLEAIHSHVGESMSYLRLALEE